MSFYTQYRMLWTKPKTVGHTQTYKSRQACCATSYAPPNTLRKDKKMKTLDTLIQTENDLETLVQRAQKTDAIALDTEFVWERTYYPNLGLIQIALSDEECYLIDPCAIKDLSALGQLLSNRSVVKIFHDAPQDLTILKRATGETPQNIFDTRLAAGFSNLPATLSLSNLVSELLDIQLAKGETRTNWLQRPLTEEQVEYALDDVRYLRAVRVILLSRLIGPKIKSWLQEELNLLNNPATYVGLSDPKKFMKTRGSSTLDRQGLAILKNLSIWREGIAQKRNRPKGHIIKDTSLIDISKKQIAKEEELRSEGGLSEKAVSKYGTTIAKIVSTTLAQPQHSYPEVKPSTRLNKADTAALEELKGLITLKGELLGVAPTLIGNSSELKTLVKTLNTRKAEAPAQLRQTEGWRKSFLEDFFRLNRNK